MAEYARRNGLKASDSLDLGNGQRIGLTLVPAGQFEMGSPLSEKDRDDNEIQHTVKLTRPVYFAQTHVTVAQWREFAATGYRTDAEKAGTVYGEKGDGTLGVVNDLSWKNPGFTQADDHPAVVLSWNDAKAFCDWLSKKSGRKVRLPSEAEYEFANRAGTATAYQWGNNPDDGRGWANCGDQSAKKKYPKWTMTFSWDDGYVYTSPVKKFKANAFGLYDMNGNAGNWCEDFYAKEYFKTRPTVDVDPKGPASGDEETSVFDQKKYASRVLRGGGWRYSTWDCRSAHRGYGTPDLRLYSLGFRVVVSLDF